MASTERKKYKHLTVSQRIQILDQLEKGVSSKYLANVFEVTVHTIYSIKKNSEKLRQQLERKHSVSVKQKKIRDPCLSELDKSLYLWFMERVATGNIITDSILRKKATELNANLGGPSTFECSRGWIWRFKKRHDVQYVQLADETTNADHEAAEYFSAMFSKLLAEKEISLHNVYRMDETGLMWRSLPQKAMHPSILATLGGDIMKRDRVTVGFCANVTGAHKLPLLFVNGLRKSQEHENRDSSRAIYMEQRNARVDGTIFLDWFENYFKPSTMQHQLRTGATGKIILLLENWNQHVLPIDKLEDEHFQIVYLPPNTSSVLQPMVQQLLTKVKLYFRCNLVKKLVQYPEGPAEFFNNYAIKDCINILHDCWEQVNERNIQLSWGRLLVNKSIYTNEETEAFTSVPETSSIVAMIQSYTILEISEKDVEDWFSHCDLQERRESFEEEFDDVQYATEEVKEETEEGRGEKGIKKEREETTDESKKVEKRSGEREEDRREVKKEQEVMDEEPDDGVAEALDVIVAWSKQFGSSVQSHANALKGFFDQRRMLSHRYQCSD